MTKMTKVQEDNLRSLLLRANLLMYDLEIASENQEVSIRGEALEQLWELSDRLRERLYDAQYI